MYIYDYLAVFQAIAPSFDSEPEEDAVLAGSVFSFPWMKEDRAVDIC